MTLLQFLSQHYFIFISLLFPQVITFLQFHYYLLVISPPGLASLNSMQNLTHFVFSFFFHAAHNAVWLPCGAWLLFPSPLVERAILYFMVAVLYNMFNLRWPRMLFLTRYWKASRPTDLIASSLFIVSLVHCPLCTRFSSSVCLTSFSYGVLSVPFLEFVCSFLFYDFRLFYLPFHCICLSHLLLWRRLS